MRAFARHLPDQSRVWLAPRLLMDNGRAHALTHTCAWTYTQHSHMDTHAPSYTLTHTPCPHIHPHIIPHMYTDTHTLQVHTHTHHPPLPSPYLLNPPRTICNNIYIYFCVICSKSSNPIQYLRAHYSSFPTFITPISSNELPDSY